MSATPAATFHLEEALYPLTRERKRCYAGWIFCRGESHCCAVRARGRGTTMHGVFGLPRPDVAAAFPEEPQAAYSGFHLTLCAANRERVRLEWMDQTGRWQEFWQDATANQPGRERQISPPVLPIHLLSALRAATPCETRNLTGPKARQRTRELVEDFTTEATPLVPDPDWLVSLDQPRGPLFSGRLIQISGWIVHRHAEVRRLFAQIDPAGMTHLIFPQARPDVVEAYPTQPVPNRCGFEGMILLPASPPVWFELRVYAECADGSVALVASRRLLRDASDDERRRTDGWRSALQLGALALAGYYRPVSWSHWGREILPRRRSALVKPKPVAPGIIVKRPNSSGRVPDPVRLVEPHETDPLISIVVPVYNTPERYLREMIASVQAQSYPRWELCLADDASTEPQVRRVLAESSRGDARIRPVYRAENGHISRASNSALAHATGEFVALLDHDDLLAPDVLLRVVETIRAQPAAQFIYTNRDKFDDQGRHFDAENRGDWNPAAAITHNYLHHLTVIRRDVILQAGAFRPEYFGSQDLDLYLRCHELLRPDEIIHVPVVGYHWRAHAGSTASRGDQKDYMFDSARRGIEDALRRRGLRAEPFLPDFGAIYGMNLHQLHWDKAILREQGVSIIFAVPADRHELWLRGLARLHATIPLSCAEIIVVSAGTLDHEQAPDMDCPMEFISAAAEVSLAELYNLGAARAHSPLLLLLEAGINPDQSGWLEDLAGWLSVPGVTAAGPKLLAANGLLASAAWTVDPVTRLPRILCAGDALNEIKPPYLSLAARDALLLDPACVLTHTAAFRELGGYDSDRFPTHYFTADYCLRLKKSGRRAVFTPQAVLTAGESVGPKLVSTSVAEDHAFRALHPGAADPWIPPAPDLPVAAVDNWMPAATLAFPGGSFFLEQPFPGEEIHAGHQVFSGWCLSRPGTTITDLRVRYGRETNPVDFGHPRPDLAANVGFTGAFLPVGFSLELGLPAGRSRLEFDAFVVGTGWQPVCVVELVVRSTPAKSRPAAITAMIPRHFSDTQELLLKQFADNPRLSLGTRAAAFAGDCPALATKRYAAAPFHGFIDNPAPHVVPMYGGVTVSGWLLHETQPVRRVAASFDLSGWLELQHNKASPDISTRFPHFPGAAHCGIFGFVTLPSDVSRPLSLRLWAELADGSWRLAFVVRSRMHALTAFDLRALLGVGTRTLWQTAWALQYAFFRAKAPGPGWQTLPSVVAELRRRLPAPGSRGEGMLSRPLPMIAAPGVPHLLLVSHNLNREGAPLFLLELARFCRDHTAIRLSVVSPFEGPLRAKFERLGAEVNLVDREPLWTSRTPQETERALTALNRELQPHAASLVVANTVDCFWAVTLAQRAGRPSLFYIHEPGVPGYHYLDQLAGHLRRAAAAALAEATCVSFTNRATQAYYLAYSSGSNYRIQPGWTAQFSLSALPSASVRARLRATLGLAPHERVVINVGTLCQRKGQLFFVYAVEQLWRTQPALAATCRFLLIGASDNAYGTSLAALVARLGRPNLELVPPTDRVQDYFGAADLFVLSSFEEGFSRVLLEAMGFALPIISTAIHGIAEITRHEQEALLVPAGDVPALTAAMHLLLADPARAARLGHHARLRLAATYTAERVLPQHLATLFELVPALKPTAPKNSARGFPEPVCAIS